MLINTVSLFKQRGENAACVFNFMENILKEVKWCQKMNNKYFNKPMRLTKKDQQDFKTADECHICNKKYSEKDIHVRDHCHITGKYRGSAHQDCNINFKLTDIFHNLRGYDSHFIMQEIGKFKLDVYVIPNNMEKYMAFMLEKHLIFIDSFQFMSSSLVKLVSNLPNEAFKYTKKKSLKMNSLSL